MQVWYMEVLYVEVLYVDVLCVAVLYMEVLYIDQEKKKSLGRDLDEKNKIGSECWEDKG